ncbi:MAG: low temperature requirement protein A [Candidatus Kariarchaeaceae archaeon]|jgi:low temperature requirement protein LtrA
MTSRSILSPEDQSVTFVELFFDLVFVFAVTQITLLLHEHFDYRHLAQATLIFWLIWWSWQQFTWALNTIDTTNIYVEFLTLLSTAIAFFMAIAIPEAFGDRGILFASTYVVTRVIGLSLQFKVSDELGQRDIVKRWASLSAIGLLFVFIGAMIGGNSQFLFWAIALILDLTAATTSAQETWAINTDHMAERHGLIIIVALGESLIVAAAGLTDHTLNSDLYMVGAISVLLTCGLWWSYFIKPKPVLETAMERTVGAERAVMTRDAFSLAHFPMVAGIIGFALAIEEAIAHPNESLSTEGSLALAIGLALFIGGTVLAVWRATGKILIQRVIFIIFVFLFIVIDLLSISEIFVALIFLVLTLISEHTLPSTPESEVVKIN